jgi:hypothetical protein
MELFQEFHIGNLPLFSLNFGTIILLPKCREATCIQQYRPICLLNASFKIFTKVATNRISQIAQKVIRQNGLILKIDFEKAYDKINWSFVQQTLRMKGLSPKWCQWVASFVEEGHVGVKVNDQVGKNFQTKNGV